MSCEKPQVLRSILRVPGDLLGQGVLGIEVEVAVEAVFLDGHVLHHADAVAKAPPLARIDVVDVHPHAFVHRRGLGDDARGILAAFLGDGAQQLDALDDAALAIDAEAHAAVVGEFLEHVQGRGGGSGGLRFAAFGIRWGGAGHGFRFPEEWFWMVMLAVVK